MSVLVDTSVWSAAFRRKDGADPKLKGALERLIDDFQAKIIGPIRQEILSGVPEKKQFESLKQLLKAFPDIPITTEEYESAAEMLHICRKKGIQGSHIDFLICAVATQHGLEIFTLDKDFRSYAQALDIKLHGH